MSSWCSRALSISATSAGLTPLPPTCRIALSPCAWPRRKRVWAEVRMTGMQAGGQEQVGAQGIMASRTARRSAQPHGHPQQVQPALVEGAFLRPLREEGTGRGVAFARGVQAGGTGRTRPPAEAVSYTHLTLP